jgi:hypothetical protein
LKISLKIPLAFLILVLGLFPGITHTRQNEAGSQNTNLQIKITDHTFDEYLYLWMWNLPWKFHHGDSIQWADPNYSDSNWQNAVTYFREGELPTQGWQGVGWFRLNVFIDSSFTQKSLAILGQANGTYDVYWDGNWLSNNIRYIIPTEITASNPGLHLLAIRYRQPVEKITTEPEQHQGFFFSLADHNKILDNLVRQRGFR